MLIWEDFKISITSKRYEWAEILQISNIVKNKTSAFKYREISLHRGELKQETAATEMLLILKFHKI